MTVKKTNGASTNAKFRKSGSRKGAAGARTFFCKEHGKNPSHNTDQCFTLNNREKAKNSAEQGSGKSAVGGSSNFSA